MPRSRQSRTHRRRKTRIIAAAAVLTAGGLAAAGPAVLGASAAGPKSPTPKASAAYGKKPRPSVTPTAKSTSRPGTPASATADASAKASAKASASTAPVAAPDPGGAPGTLPLTLTNNSGRSDQVHVYVIGTELSSGRNGYADASGTFHAWPAGAQPPVAAPDASFAGPAAGASMTVHLPKFSGRVYFSYGKKLVFKLAEGGLVQPAVQSPTDPNHDILFNWSEYTLNDAGLWINSTQVDMFSAPYTVGVTGEDGRSRTTGKLKPGGYRALFEELRGEDGGWDSTVVTGPDGTPLRALAPGHAIGAGTGLPAGVMDDYVNRVWSTYTGKSLTVTPFGDRPELKYQGRVSGNTMNFTDSKGAVVASFPKPDSDSIFGCYKDLDAPNDLVKGPIARTLCAGFNRTTLLTNAQQPDSGGAGFYADAVTNEYARAVHEQMVDGRAYAFAFDDVGAHESLVHDGAPRRAAMSLEPLD